MRKLKQLEELEQLKWLKHFKQKQFRKKEQLGVDIRKQVKGMYTIEAALLLPLLLFTIAAGLRTGIELYSEVKKISEEYSAVTEIDEMAIVHKIQRLAELGGK